MPSQSTLCGFLNKVRLSCRPLLQDPVRQRTTGFYLHLTRLILLLSVMVFIHQYTTHWLLDTLAKEKGTSTRGQGKWLLRSSVYLSSFSCLFSHTSHILCSFFCSRTLFILCSKFLVTSWATDTTGLFLPKHHSIFWLDRCSSLSPKPLNSNPTYCQPCSTHLRASITSQPPQLEK